MLATSLPVAQWLERPTGVRKVMGSIPVGDSDFFFVPRSRHVGYSIFSYFFSELKIHHASLFSFNFFL